MVTHTYSTVTRESKTIRTWVQSHPVLNESKINGERDGEWGEGKKLISHNSRGNSMG